MASADPLVAVHARMLPPLAVPLRRPGGEQVVHPWQRFGGRSVDYHHYLCELAREPPALRHLADELIRAPRTVRVGVAAARRRARPEAGRARVRPGAARVEELGERAVVGARAHGCWCIRRDLSANRTGTWCASS